MCLQKSRLSVVGPYVMIAIFSHEVIKSVFMSWQKKNATDFKCVFCAIKLKSFALISCPLIFLPLNQMGLQIFDLVILLTQAERLDYSVV